MSRRGRFAAGSAGTALKSRQAPAEFLKRHGISARVQALRARAVPPIKRPAQIIFLTSKRVDVPLPARGRQFYRKRKMVAANAVCSESIGGKRFPGAGRWSVLRPEWICRCSSCNQGKMCHRVSPESERSSAW